jgi:hypothetical protein
MPPTGMHHPFLRKTLSLVLDSRDLFFGDIFREESRECCPMAGLELENKE